MWGVCVSLYIEAVGADGISILKEEYMYESPTGNEPERIISRIAPVINVVVVSASA